MSPAARSQETTHRPRHFRRTSGEVLVAVRRFGACSLRAFLWEECPFCFFVRS